MDGYWSRMTISRRQTLRAASLAAGGLAALSLVGCGGSSTKKAPAESQPKSGAALDPTKGIPGGKMVIQGASAAAGVQLVKTSNASINQYAGFTHSGLLEFRHGTPVVSGTDISLGPDLAQALPEQVDAQTYVYKLRSAKFHNGRAVTSEDVKYSFERYAFAADSAYKAPWFWLDKVETPDPQTAIVKTKAPYADGLLSMAGRNDGFILAKEHEESPDAVTKMIGSGAFRFVEQQQPVVTRFRKNPDYFLKPYPYFDSIELIGQSDSPKKVADFSSHQTQMTYWHGEDEALQIKQARPDAQNWRWEAPGNIIGLRTDQAPLNDKRVRQALSMAIDRKAIRDAVTRGNGEPDQVLSWAGVRAWGWRKPSELGAAAKYWSYDPQAAKQLLSAAGVTGPIDTSMMHWDASVVGQGLVDTATLIETNWKTLGIANLKDNIVTFGQATTTYVIGNFDGFYVAPGGTTLGPAVGLAIKTQFWSPPDGVNVPTLNTGHVNDQPLSALIDKQLVQLNPEERKQTFRQMEDIFAEQQYRLVLSNYYYNYFGDPSVKNMQVPLWSYNSGLGFVKYWWFDKA